MFPFALPLLLAIAQQATPLPPGTPVVARDAPTRLFTLGGADSAPEATPVPDGISPEVGGMIAPQNFPPGDVGALTGLFGYDGCSDDQKRTLTDALSDALALAQTAITQRDELVIERAQINWNSPPAVAYFGTADQSKEYQNNILGAWSSFVLVSILLSGQEEVMELTLWLTDVFENATMTKSRWGDWWNDRYVSLRCDADLKECGDKAAAYTALRKQPYTQIFFCPNYFDKLEPHRELWDKMVDDPSLQNNVANLRSQATTMLHEWLHIDDPKTRVCRGCWDVWSSWGPKQELHEHLAQFCSGSWFRRGPTGASSILSIRRSSLPECALLC